jgi:hypothetical protein
MSARTSAHRAYFGRAIEKRTATMNEPMRRLRQAVHVAGRLARAVEALSTPWLLLGCRVWLAQIVLVRQVVAMMASADHASPNAAVGHALADEPLASPARH